jgi:hypothetical protein
MMNELEINVDMVLPHITGTRQGSICCVKAKAMWVMIAVTVLG